MRVDDTVIFILPVCDFSVEESQEFSTTEKIIKYRFPGFMEDINNRIVSGEEKQGDTNILKQAV